MYELIYQALFFSPPEESLGMRLISSRSLDTSMAMIYGKLTGVYRKWDYH
jgi:hypothetical protein